MSRRIRQGIKDIEMDIGDFERTVQKVKDSKNKPVDHKIKRDKQLKPFVTEPIADVMPRLGQKSKQKTESREIHKEVLENKNATVVITVRTKHSHVRKKRNKSDISPRKRDMPSIPKECRKSSHSGLLSKDAASLNEEKEVKRLPWSSLLNNQQFEYDSCSSVYSDYSRRNNLQSDKRSTTESNYVYKKNCSTFAQKHDYEFKARVDQSVQCAEPQCEYGKADPIGALKSLFTDVLCTLQKSRNDGNMERNLNIHKTFIEDEPVRLPREEDKSRRNVGFTPVHPEKSSPPQVISAPVAVLPGCQSQTCTASSSPGSMQKQLEVTNLLLEQTYREIAMKCEEYRKERDKLREEVIQQQKKVQVLMEKEKDHLLVISSLQADINNKSNKLQHQAECTPKTETSVVCSSRRNSELEMEIQLLKLQSEKYQTLMASKEKEILHFRQELQNIHSLIQEQLENCKLMHHRIPSDGASSVRRGDKPVCSSPTSSVTSLGTIRSWQKISSISPSNDLENKSDAGVILGEKLTVPDVKLNSPKHGDKFRSTILEAAAAISDTESVQKMRKELSKVFEEIRNSRIPLPSPPHSYMELHDSQWTDLSVDTLQNGAGSLSDAGLMQATDDG